MDGIRTDLAAEGHALNAERGVDDGIVISEYDIDGVPVVRAEVLDREGEEKSGRPAGVYLTVDTGRVWLKSGAERAAASEAVRSLLEGLIPRGEGAVLVAGLGNEAVTPDAIGPATVGGLVVTHHMKRLDPGLYGELGFGDVAAICPGVMGQTGVESARLIKAAADVIKPRCVIAIDALAARGLERLGTTVQLTDTGIAPGSGVGGGREELSKRTLGCPVIGVGVPTVVDARTVALELAGSEPSGYRDFFVTPKETDVMVRVQSRLLASAINRALHSDAGDIEEYAPL